MERIAEYTVGELARMAGVSVRRLHHYHATGLLRPAHVATNGYRLYGRAEAERLQEILILRGAGLGLSEIASLLDGADRTARLAAQKARLTAERGRIDAMLGVLDAAMAAATNGETMTTDALYRGLPPETQADYEAWLIATYGAEMAEAIAASKAHLVATPPGMEARMEALRGIEAALVADYEGGVAPGDAGLAAHRDWVAAMWGRPCPPEAHAGLAELYAGHPDFIARFEALSPGFSAWLIAAMRAKA